MKNLTVGAGFLVLIASVATAAEPVTESRVWTESYAVNALTPHLAISNIWGNIRVRSGSPGQILITVDERRSAPSRALFARSLETLKLDVEADDGQVSILVGERSQRWGHRDACPGCRVDYQFEVVVPTGTQIDVETVLDGTIDIAGIAGTISASNVNGPIVARELHGCEVLESVNGSVDLSFVQAPGQNCDIETVNGDITLVFPDGSGLDVALGLFNGRVVSEFPVEPFVLPAQVEHTRTDGRHRYRIQQSAGLRLQGGGPTFSMSSLNGDIRIQKAQ